MKGRASQISCLSRKVRSMKWRPFWGIVKNARFHPTKHLSQWVSSQLKIGNLLFFGAHRDFRLFCSRWLFFLRNDHHVRAKWLTEVSRQKNKHNFLWGKEQKYWPQMIYCDFFRKLVAPSPNFQNFTILGARASLRSKLKLHQCIDAISRYTFGSLILFGSQQEFSNVSLHEELCVPLCGCRILSTNSNALGWLYLLRLMLVALFGS